MYEPTASLNLHRLSRQSLQKRYESDEEDVSESEAGAQDFVPSLVGSQRAGTFDSDLSADENSQADPDSDRDEQLLSPYSTAKRPRPVSMDTVKRNSNPNFGDDAYVFDPEEEMVFELPSPDSPPMASSLYLQPAIYVRPDLPPAHPKPRSRSPSPSSIFSVESAEIQTAKKVTMIEPPTRPTVVFINAIGVRSKAARSRPSHSRTRANPRDRGSRMFPDMTESSLNVPRLAENQATSLRPSETHGKREGQKSPKPAMLPATTPSMQSATINRVSEIPVLPYIPPSPQLRPQSMYRSRPRTAGCEKSFPTLLNPSRTRRPTDLSHRPASVRTNSNGSVPSYSRPASPLSDDIRPGYIVDHSETASLYSNPYTCSPASSPRPPSHFSKRSMSNMLAQKSPMMRRMTRKHSATSSIASLASLRSEMDAPAPIPAAASQPSLTSMNYESRVVRKPSQRRHGRHNSSAFGGRGFMGLKLGKRSFTKA
ncbi:hypothetical protein N7448_000132 [Penicillium atrosanguineum]|uniref:Uncharacterized protein n=1 Tax=Penicillium atrosanguineum TaxID=1132637 RepID=A0A9W9Q4D7_9EURO|nr:uncharacterized protein N7443_003533 [Penicillium atrosanguineum]KAJ5148554.1 hypothetical protein N7448_000132 [Penicillium atrosanguineum]KAJ5303873.1 hypothetical protein N7443_003533 [Penicillium atrosanguineum]KAJ5323348.1 hypothetical protein N7476_001948 [Penicillium atrosanguineum]